MNWDNTNQRATALNKV